MEKKYRIKLNDGRVIGPLVFDDVCKLIKLKKLTGNENVQIFPLGDWEAFSSFKELSEKLLEGKSNPNSDPVSGLMPDSKLDEENPKEGALQEEKKSHPILESNDNEVEPKASKDKEERSDDKTLVLDRSSLKDEIGEGAKTKVIHIDNLDSLSKELGEEAEGIEEVLTDDAISSRPDMPLEDDDADIKPFEEVEDINFSNETIIAKDLVLTEDIKAEVLASDEMAKEVILSPSKSSKETKRKIKIPVVPKKNIRPIALLAIIVLLFFLLFDDSKGPESEIELVYARVIFPVVEEYEDENDSASFFKKGEERIHLPSYSSQIVAAEFYRKSLENKFKDNKALGRLIYLYAKLLPDTKDKFKEAGVLFKLIELGKGKSLDDEYYAIGVSEYYYNLGKFYSASKALDRYRKKNKGLSDIFFAQVLRVSAATENVEVSDKAYKTLESLKSKKYEVYKSMIEYELGLYNFDRAEKLILEAIKIFDNDIDLLLKYSNILVRKKDFNNLDKVLKILGILQKGGSPKYLAKFLEYSAIYAVSINQKDKALELFNESLKYDESLELRSMLAGLQLGGGAKVENLIVESKAINFIRISKNFMKEKKWDPALFNAIRAVDIAPGNIEALLHLVKIQRKRGLFGEAIKILLSLRKKYFMDKNIAYGLIETYIDAYKFTAARKLIGEFATTQERDTGRYHSVAARLYLKSGNYLHAVRSLKKSIAANPINDQDYFELVKIYIKIKKFKKAKKFLARAISLDPLSEIYRVEYARILYETKSASAAIGYLNSLQSEYPDNVKIIGSLAIYHYKEGKIVQFDYYKNKLKELGKGSDDLLRYSIDLAKLEGDQEQVVILAKELGRVDPGNLKNQMLLGETYLALNKVDSALKIFEGVREKLNSYPEVLYYLSKISILKGDLAKAKDYATQEVEQNKSVSLGHILLGDIYTKEKDYQVAEKHYKEALKIDSNSASALKGLAWLQYKKNYFESALDLYQKASKTEPNSPYLRKQLGHVYRKLGQGALALESYKIYLDLSPAARDRTRIEKIMSQLK